MPAKKPAELTAVRAELNAKSKEGPEARPGLGPCRLWMRGKRGIGYGIVRYEGQLQGSHRVAYKVFVGPIPAGLHVLHKCDVPDCIRPDHLFLGTSAENAADREAKGRGAHVRGERIGSAKLTVAEVIAIRADCRLQREIAADFGVTPQQISDIKSGKKWRHVPLTNDPDRRRAIHGGWGVSWTPTRTVAHILAEHHYLGSVRRGVAWHDEFGVIVLAAPTARRLPASWLELVRWWRRNDHPSADRGRVQHAHPAGKLDLGTCGQGAIRRPHGTAEGRRRCRVTRARSGWRIWRRRRGSGGM